MYSSAFGENKFDTPHRLVVVRWNRITFRDASYHINPGYASATASVVPFGIDAGRHWFPELQNLISPLPESCQTWPRYGDGGGDPTEIGIIDVHAESTQCFNALSVVSYHNFRVSTGDVVDRTIPAVSWKCQFGNAVVDVLVGSYTYAVPGVVDVLTQNCPRVGLEGGVLLEKFYNKWRKFSQNVSPYTGNRCPVIFIEVDVSPSAG